MFDLLYKPDNQAANNKIENAFESLKERYDYRAEQNVQGILS